MLFLLTLMALCVAMPSTRIKNHLIHYRKALKSAHKVKHDYSILGSEHDHGHAAYEHLKRGEWEAAVSSAERALDVNVNYCYAWWVLARAYNATGFQKRSNAYLKQLTRCLPPTDTRSYVDLRLTASPAAAVDARTLRVNNDVGMDVGQLRSSSLSSVAASAAASNVRASANNYIKLAAEYRDRKLNDFTLQLLLASLRLVADRVDALYFIGELLKEQEQYHLAKRYYRAALQVDAVHSPSLYALGELSVAYDADCIQALFYHRRALDAASSNDARSFRSIADTYRKCHMYAYAAEHYRYALNVDSNNFDDMYYLGVVNRRLEKYGVAARHQESLIELATYTESYLELGHLALLEGDWLRALEHFAKCIQRCEHLIEGAATASASGVGGFVGSSINAQFSTRASEVSFHGVVGAGSGHVDRVATVSNPETALWMAHLLLSFTLMRMNLYGEALLHLNQSRELAGNDYARTFIHCVELHRAIADYDGMNRCEEPPRSLANTATKGGAAATSAAVDIDRAADAFLRRRQSTTPLPPWTFAAETFSQRARMLELQQAVGDINYAAHSTLPSAEKMLRIGVLTTRIESHAEQLLSFTRHLLAKYGDKVVLHLYVAKSSEESRESVQYCRKKNSNEFEEIVGPNRRPRHRQDDTSTQSLSSSSSTSPTSPTPSSSSSSANSSSSASLALSAAKESAAVTALRQVATRVVDFGAAQTQTAETIARQIHLNSLDILLFADGPTLEYENRLTYGVAMRRPCEIQISLHPSRSFGDVTSVDDTFDTQAMVVADIDYGARLNDGAMTMTRSKLRPLYKIGDDEDEDGGANGVNEENKEERGAVVVQEESESGEEKDDDDDDEEEEEMMNNDDPGGGETAAEEVMDEDEKFEKIDERLLQHAQTLSMLLRPPRHRFFDFVVVDRYLLNDDDERQLLAKNVITMPYHAILAPHRDLALDEVDNDNKKGKGNDEDDLLLPDSLIYVQKLLEMDQVPLILIAYNDDIQCFYRELLHSIIHVLMNGDFNVQLYLMQPLHRHAALNIRSEILRAANNDQTMLKRVHMNIIEDYCIEKHDNEAVENQHSRRRGRLQQNVASDARILFMRQMSVVDILIDGSCNLNEFNIDHRQRVLDALWLAKPVLTLRGSVIGARFASAALSTHCESNVNDGRTEWKGGFEGPEEDTVMNSCGLAFYSLSAFQRRLSELVDPSSGALNRLKAQLAALKHTSKLFDSKAYSESLGSMLLRLIELKYSSSSQAPDSPDFIMHSSLVEAHQHTEL